MLLGRRGDAVICVLIVVIFFFRHPRLSYGGRAMHPAYPLGVFARNPLLTPTRVPLEPSSVYQTHFNAVSPERGDHSGIIPASRFVDGAPVAMSSFFSKFFGGARKEPPASINNLKAVEQPQASKSGRREPPVELDLSKCPRFALPSSPPTWEVDGRVQFHNDYKDPVLGPIFNAGFTGKFSTVIKMAGNLTQEQQQGAVGEIIANAYAKVIIQRMKAGQLVAAAKQSLEMFTLVPTHVKDVDRRRFNKVLAQMDKEGKKHNFTPVEVVAASAQPVFTQPDHAPWILHDERKLRADEKSTLAFDLIAMDGAGTWQVARMGTGQSTKHMLRRTDQRGTTLGEKTLDHDVYRRGASAAGMAIMDSSGVLHVYDTDLNTITVSNLRKDPRVVEHFRTIKTNYWGEFKSQVRAVDFSATGDRYLFTLADEAWCCDRSGNALWGVSMPLNDGWERFNENDRQPKVDPRVENALRELGLSLPTTTDEIKQKYRRLALKYHPDRNPGNEAATTEKMKSVNLAFEVLTGIDPTTLDFGDPDFTHFARTSPDSIIEANGIRFEITILGGAPQDWIYAAKFTEDGGAYLATYSGMVVQVSPQGMPSRVFEMKAHPSGILTTGHQALFLTPTRLHVIDEGKPVAVLDTYKQGDPLISENGFWLLASKKLQRFSWDGKKVGEWFAKDPIRAAYQSDAGAIIQTRQHQVEVLGLQ
jgi:hypothetical protein